MPPTSPDCLPPDRAVLSAAAVAPVLYYGYGATAKWLHLSGPLRTAPSTAVLLVSLLLAAELGALAVLAWRRDCVVAPALVAIWAVAWPWLEGDTTLVTGAVAVPFLGLVLVGVVEFGWNNRSASGATSASRASWSLAAVGVGYFLVAFALQVAARSWFVSAGAPERLPYVVTVLIVLGLIAAGTGTLAAWLVRPCGLVSPAVLLTVWLVGGVRVVRLRAPVSQAVTVDFLSPVPTADYLATPVVPLALVLLLAGVESTARAVAVW